MCSFAIVEMLPFMQSYVEEILPRLYFSAMRQRLHLIDVSTSIFSLKLLRVRVTSPHSERLGHRSRLELQVLSNESIVTYLLLTRIILYTPY